MSTPR